MDSFAEMMMMATGQVPYPYQERIAAHGLPELLAVPTGTGKTAATVLPWLWRRRFHPDRDIRSGTPRWLVFCLPMRVLTEQVEGDVRSWLASLGLLDGSDAVGVHVMMGGRDRVDDRLRLEPERDAVVIGTLDMLISRALNRGYGASRFAWPIDFGLLHNGCHWVFDEVQLMGPALATSRQLAGLRQTFGTAIATASTWMSATVDLDAMITVDNPTVTSTTELGDDDRSGPLASRLDARKVVRRVELDPKHPGTSVAAAIVEHHTPGTLSVAVFNTVRAARDVHSEVTLLRPDAEVVLLHSRFRPPERRAQVGKCLAELDPRGPGRIVVSTQVLEAGVNLSATVLFTEVAPWPSIVQRAGRCNRDGTATSATLLWGAPARPEPYMAEDLAAAEASLVELEGEAVTAVTLRARQVPAHRPVYAILRRRDLLGLFDTAPDLSGNDIDVAPFIRVSDDLDVLVAWRSLGGTGPPPREVMPTADELCPVPVGREFREAIRDRGWHFDHLAGAWSRLDPRRARPGMVVLLDAARGGYRLDVGWDPSSDEPVPLHPSPAETALMGPDEAIGDDPVTFSTARWIALRQHLADVEKMTAELAERLGPLNLAPAAIEAAVVAGRLHDIGKAHPVFQGTMARCADEADRASRVAGGPWAKSGGPNRARHERRFFRHELASALALLGEGSAALEGVADPDLVVYLVAAHHGRVRLGIRSIPDREADTVLGIADGERLPEVDTPAGVIPSAALSLAPMGLGRHDGEQSWSERSLALLGREELGPFRLAFLEALVRLADWRASSSLGGAEL